MWQYAVAKHLRDGTVAPWKGVGNGAVLSAPAGIDSALLQNATSACDSERRQVEVSWGAARFIVFPRRTFTFLPPKIPKRCVILPPLPVWLGESNPPCQRLTRPMVSSDSTRMGLKLPD